MTPPVLQYPLDLTGTAATNRVTGERHIVAATGARAVATKAGPFFTRGMVVRNAITNQELIPGTDYLAVHLFQEATLRTGREVCSVVLIQNGVSGTEFLIEYQAIGGEYSASIDAIEQMLESLDLDNRVVHWADLLGRPEYFDPAPHLHDIGDLYGFEYVTAVLHQIERAILIGDQASHDELRQYVDLRVQAVRDTLTGVLTRLDDHVNNTNNPHNTTKTHVGLGNVQNYAVATQQDAVDGAANNLYMTPLRTKQAIEQFAGETLSSHITNQNNPHNVTKAQVGLGLVQNYPIASSAQAISGSGTAYITASLLGTALQSNNTPFTAHIANTSNPHNTTKSHVGLGSVDNYATATAIQAAAGTATNLFLTPAGGRQLVETLVGNNLTSHVNNTNNPHNVTKAQVGLGLVQNYAVADNAQAAAGAANDLYMTPATSKYLIDQWWATAGSNINSHIANTNNPHSTTKAQVGLGSVQDYGIATQADATSGTSNVLYMTPIRTKQAIDAIAVTPLQNQINQRVVIDSNASLATVNIGGRGYFYAEADGSLSLRVNGNRYYKFGSDGNFQALSGRVVGAYGFRPSDRRLKKDIKDVVARPLWRMVDLKGYTLREDGRYEVGSIAQDMVKHAPDRVSTVERMSEKGRVVKRMAVDYAGAAYEMAHAAGSEVDALRAEVEELRKVIQHLTAKVG